MKRGEIREIGNPAMVERLAEDLCEQGPLAGIPVNVVADVIRSAAMVELETGELLVREGEAATPEVYLLLEGSLAVQAKTGFIARLDKPGDVIGEAAVVLHSKRNADVVAETAVRALSIPAAVLAEAEFAEVAAGIRSAMLRDDWVQY